MKRVFSLIVLGWTLVLGACTAPTAPPPAAPVVAQAAASNTPLPSPTDTAVPPTATNTATMTHTATSTYTATATKTPTVTSSPTNTATATHTATLTPTNVPPTATFTATRRPATRAPTKPPAPAKSFSTTWKTDMGYEGRDANSQWCQIHNETQNLTAEEMLFQTFDQQNLAPVLLRTYNATLARGGYQPIFGIANADGSINRWMLAGWYAKAFGWPNGIEQFPPNGVAGGASSGDWTWYSVARAGEFCKFVYVRWKGQRSVSEYAPDGKLINTNATLPSGAP